MQSLAYVVAYVISPALVLGFLFIGPVAVGKVARARGYNALNWGLASMLITPILGAILVSGLPDRHLHKKLDRLIDRQPTLDPVPGIPPTPQPAPVVAAAPAPTHSPSTVGQEPAPKPPAPKPSPQTSVDSWEDSLRKLDQ
ncbi:MAG: hypothetical protein TH68_01935, partial [Candidatus Synechococcus spongiarum 142]